MSSLNSKKQEKKKKHSPLLSISFQSHCHVSQCFSLTVSCTENPLTEALLLSSRKQYLRLRKSSHPVILGLTALCLCVCLENGKSIYGTGHFSCQHTAHPDIYLMLVIMTQHQVWLMIDVAASKRRPPIRTTKVFCWLFKIEERFWHMVDRRQEWSVLLPHSKSVSCSIPSGNPHMKTCRVR